LCVDELAGVDVEPMEHYDSRPLAATATAAGDLKDSIMSNSMKNLGVAT
jgi:hypothetical protein